MEASVVNGFNSKNLVASSFVELVLSMVKDQTGGNCLVNMIKS